MARTSKIALLFFLLLFSFIQARSQQIEWGPVNISNTSSFTPHIIGHDSAYIYSASSEFDKIYFERYRKSDLALDFSMRIKKPDASAKQVDYEGIYLMDNSFVVFTSYFDLTESTTSIFADVYDASLGIKTVNQKAIMTMDNPGRKLKGGFSVFVSNDRSKVLVNFTGYYKAEKCYKDKYILLNHNLEVITEKEEIISFDEIDYRTFNYFIDNNGSFYHVKKRLDGKTFIVSYDARMDYEKWESLVDLSSLHRDTRVYNTKFFLNAKNELIFAGYYTKNGRSLDGTFIMRLGIESNEVISVKANTFSDSIKLELVPRIAYVGNSNERINIGHYNNLEIFKQNDGGFVLIGENVDINSTNDLIILGHSPQGELLWSKSIYKSQYATNYTFKYLFYFGMIQNNQLNLYFYEGGKSTASGNWEAAYLKKMSKVIPVCYSIELDSGNITKSMMEPRLFDTYFTPGASYQKRYDTDAIFFSQFNKKYRLGIIRYKPVI